MSSERANGLDILEKMKKPKYKFEYSSNTRSMGLMNTANKTVNFSFAKCLSSSSNRVVNAFRVSQGLKLKYFCPRNDPMLIPYSIWVTLIRAMKMINDYRQNCQITNPSIGM